MRTLLRVCAGAIVANLACVWGAGAAQITATVSAKAQPMPDAVVVAVP